MANRYVEVVEAEKCPGGTKALDLGSLVRVSGQNGLDFEVCWGRSFINPLRNNQS
jgi:hypothetical protein